MDIEVTETTLPVRAGRNMVWVKCDGQPQNWRVNVAGFNDAGGRFSWHNGEGQVVATLSALDADQEFGAELNAVTQNVTFIAG